MFNNSYSQMKPGGYFQSKQHNYKDMIKLAHQKAKEYRDNQTEIKNMTVSMD